MVCRFSMVFPFFLGGYINVSTDFVRFFGWLGVFRCFFGGLKFVVFFFFGGGSPRVLKALRLARGCETPRAHRKGYSCRGESFFLWGGGPGRTGRFLFFFLKAVFLWMDWMSWMRWLVFWEIGFEQVFSPQNICRLFCFAWGFA